MSQHQSFRRQPVPPQVAQQLETITFPAPTRGIDPERKRSLHAARRRGHLDNWKPTMKGVSLRGGCDRWAELPETTPVISAFEYASGINHKMFAANATKSTTSRPSTPVAGQERADVAAITSPRSWPTRAATG